MTESGINANIFGSHSTRSAPTSKCKVARLWFKKMCKVRKMLEKKTFTQFCDIPTQEDFSYYVFK